MSIVEKYWDDAREGDEAITPSYTVTRERIRAYADLTGDYTPVHVDEEYAKASHFGGLVAHGLMGLSIADGLKTQCGDQVATSGQGRAATPSRPWHSRQAGAPPTSHERPAPVPGTGIREDR